jgi:histidyl-tRNA synthetase
MLLGKGAAAAPTPLVVVAVMDKDTRPDLMALVSELRAAGIRAEMYMGDSAMKAQLRYADARCARLVVIEGEDERAKGEVTLKDLQLGAEKSAEIEDNAEWRASEHAQKQVKRADLVAEIQKIISYFVK